MAKIVLTTKVNPTYDDLPEVRYHFPRRYLGRIEQAIGDEVIYYEPRREDDAPGGRAGRQAYIATARISAIELDPNLPNHYYARITEYIDFDSPVPFKEVDQYYESALRKEDGSTNKGAFGSAARIIPDAEFDLILAAGFTQTLRAQEPSERAVIPGLSEEPAIFTRQIQEQIVRRPFRDVAFTRQVGAAYDFTCALTGIRLVNGGGRKEVEAAHIRPVGNNHSGPDSVRNGIALCQTVHWMFDRGIISLTDDFKLLVDPTYVASDVRRLFRPELRASVPSDPSKQPHSQFLEYHRRIICDGRTLVRAQV